MKINSKGLTSFDFITNWEGDEGPLIFKVLKRGCSSSDLSEVHFFSLLSFLFPLHSLLSLQIIEELYIKAVKAKNPDMQRCFHVSFSHHFPSMIIPHSPSFLFLHRKKCSMSLRLFILKVGPLNCPRGTKVNGEERQVR